jgi:hypothetical protein
MDFILCDSHLCTRLLLASLSRSGGLQRALPPPPHTHTQLFPRTLEGWVGESVCERRREEEVDSTLTSASGGMTLT